MIEAENVYHKFNTICQSKDKSKSRCMQTKTIPQNQVSNHTKDSTNTDNNRFPNTKPKVQQVANHLTNY